MVIANDDTTGIESESRAAEVREAVYGGSGHWVCDGPHVGTHAPECASCDGGRSLDLEECCNVCDGLGRIDEGPTADTDEFSWRPCDCCGSKLGGSRHRCAILGDESEG